MIKRKERVPVRRMLEHLLDRAIFLDTAGPGDGGGWNIYLPLVTGDLVEDILLEMKEQKTVMHKKRAAPGRERRPKDSNETDC